MYIADETVVQLYELVKKIPTEYGYKPYLILSQVIVNSQKKKEADNEHDQDVPALSE